MIQFENLSNKSYYPNLTISDQKIIFRQISDSQTNGHMNGCTNRLGSGYSEVKLFN